MLYQDEKNVRKGKWTAEEDALLAAYIAKHGEGKWKMVRKRAGINRSAQSCRLRWTSHLHSSVKKGPLTPEEEYTILQLHEQHGNKWARIALQLPGRTDTGIKNYVNALLRKGERAKEKAARRLASSWKHMMTRSLPQLHGGEATPLSSGDFDYRPNAGQFYGMRDEATPPSSEDLNFRPNGGKFYDTGDEATPLSSRDVDYGPNARQFDGMGDHATPISSASRDLEYRPQSGKFDAMGISNQRGPEDCDMLMTDGALLDGMKELLDQLDGLSTPEVPQEQPQHTNSMMDMNCLFAHGDDQFGMSIYGVDGNIQVPAPSTMPDTSLLSSTFSTGPQLLQDSSHEMIQYNYDADQRYALDSAQPNCWRNSSEQDMSNLQVACIPEPRNVVQTVPYNSPPLAGNLSQIVPYNSHPLAGNLGQIVPYNLVPSKGSFSAATPAVSPYVYTDPSFENYGATHIGSTHAEQNLGQIVRYNLGPSKGSFTAGSPAVSPYVYTDPSFENYGHSATYTGSTYAEHSRQLRSYVPPSQNTFWMSNSF